MTDELIINGFRSFDKTITRDYFYGYCRKAYGIFANKYQLRNKTGLDFYSLAHDYYISLLVHDFKPLLDRPTGIKLSTWMTNGFRFVVLDALKAYNKEFANAADTTADDVLEYVRSSDYEDGMMFQIADAVSSYYQSDQVMQQIAHYIFYEGYPQKDVAAMIHITPSAVNQRYKKMMDEVVTPFVIENYSEGLYKGAMFEVHEDMAEYGSAACGRAMAPRRMAEAPRRRVVAAERLELPKPTVKERIFVFLLKLKHKLFPLKTVGQQHQNY